MENKNQEKFQYSYSAKEQEEIQSIRRKYAATAESKMDRLRRLDAGVAQKASVVALVIGVSGALILGTGMSLVMTDLGTMLRLDPNLSLILGIGTGVLGMILVALAYPLYNRTLKKERERVAPEILLLTEELMK